LISRGATICSDENKSKFNEFAIDNNTHYRNNMLLGTAASIGATLLLHAISNDYRNNIAATAIFGIASVSLSGIKSKTYLAAAGYSAASALLMVASSSEELSTVYKISCGALALGTFCYSAYACTQEHTPVIA
jgi:hypothetical protein